MFNLNMANYVLKAFIHKILYLIEEIQGRSYYFIDFYIQILAKKS